MPWASPAELAQFTADIRLDRLPPEVVKRARFLVLDLVGNIVRARHDAESTPSLLAAARAHGHGRRQFRRVRRRRALHPGGRGVPERRAGAFARLRRHPCGRLAASGRAGDPGGAGGGRDGRRAGADVLAAIVAGYEVTCRVALALPAGDHYDRGFHPTATCGAFGAAAAAARVFGLMPSGVQARSASR